MSIMEDAVKDTDLDLQEIPSEEEDLDVDNAPYEIRSQGADFTLELFAQKIGTKEIVVPPFQRNYVWPQKKASKLIESFLLGLPVPQVFLYQEASKRDLLVVDGQQRLLTANYFFNNTLAGTTTQFRLRGVKQKWEGKTFDELEEGDKRRLKNYILRATIFEQVNPADDKSVYEIFERLNTGGMALTEQEVRNCVNRGSINAFLDEVNRTDSWRQLLGRTEPDRRMKDIEMVLRVFALVENWTSYKKPMKDFISAFMRDHKDIPITEQKRLKTMFKSLADTILEQAGATAFQLTRGRNVAVLDSTMVAIAVVGPKRITDLKNRLQTLKTNGSYVEYVSKATTDDDSVRGRIKMSIEAFSTQA